MTYLICYEIPSISHVGKDIKGHCTTSIPGGLTKDSIEGVCEAVRSHGISQFSTEPGVKFGPLIFRSVTKLEEPK